MRKRCTRHRAFYLMLSLACGRIVFLFGRLLCESAAMHLRQAYIFCARSVCIGYVFSEICQLSPFGSHKLVVAYVLQGVISVSASTAARDSKPWVIVG